MDWLNNLFFGQSVAHYVLTLAIVITLGIVLGRVKIGGVSLGITWILFVGIAAAHFGMTIDAHVLHFLKEFGLILFVYSIGLQIGPSFFSSFKKLGLKMNIVAVSIVAMGVATCLAIHYICKIPMPTMVGILSGAVTNTPGLGAATEAYRDSHGVLDSTISLGYAIAYPLGVLGMIFTITFIKYLPRFSKPSKNPIQGLLSEPKDAVRINLIVRNPAIVSKSIAQIRSLLGRKFVISRILTSDNSVIIPSHENKLSLGDKVLVVTNSADTEAVSAYIGESTDIDWDSIAGHMIARRIMVTNSSANGETLKDLKLFNQAGFNITRVNRAGIDLVAHENLALQIGDRVTAVGGKMEIEKAEKLLGNSMMNLRHPNLIPIFLGIFLGVLVGSIPIAIPGLPQAAKIGLAGGPLIVAILLSRFGYNFKLATYTTVSANLMLREVGISLFLACVGIGAGAEFFDTLINQNGYIWILYGALITIIPTLSGALIARYIFKFDYLTVIGMISGSSTNPPALAYSNAVAGNDIPSVAYATVYPLTMFLRILTAQILILLII